jgi:glycosyltransferase involved in cell wall biosynthesis
MPPVLSPEVQLSNSIRPLRIALLGYRSHPHVGGQGIYLKYLSRALVQMGHQVDVISGPPYPELDDAVRLIKIPSLDLYSHPHPTRALRWKHLFVRADFYEWWSKLTGAFGEPYCFGLRLKTYFKKNPPDYDIIHDNQSLCSALVDIQKHYRNLVVTIHHPITHDRDLALQAASTNGQQWLVKRWYSFIEMQLRVVRQLDHIVTVSRQSRQDILQAFSCKPEAVKVIPCGVDTEIFSLRPDIKREAFRLITTASSDQPLKGLSILLNAFSRLLPEFPELTLIVIGKLKEDGSTEKELHQLQLQNKVQFKSGISTDDLIIEYAKATLAIVPSLYEGFGLPAAEALACGVPLISSDGGALPEVVGEAAYLVKAGDIDALKNSIRLLLQDPSLREALSIKGREHGLQQLCWSRVAEEMTAFYRQVLVSNNSKHLLSNKLASEKE